MVPPQCYVSQVFQSAKNSKRESLKEAESLQGEIKILKDESRILKRDVSRWVSEASKWGEEKGGWEASLGEMRLENSTLCEAVRALEEERRASRQVASMGTPGRYRLTSPVKGMGGLRSGEEGRQSSEEGVKMEAGGGRMSEEEEEGVCLPSDMVDALQMEVEALKYELEASERREDEMAEERDTLAKALGALERGALGELVRGRRESASCVDVGTQAVMRETKEVMRETKEMYAGVKDSRLRPWASKSIGVMTMEVEVNGERVETGSQMSLSPGGDVLGGSPQRSETRSEGEVEVGVKERLTEALGGLQKELARVQEELALVEEDRDFQKGEVSMHRAERDELEALLHASEADLMVLQEGSKGEERERLEAIRERDEACGELRKLRDVRDAAIRERDEAEMTSQRLQEELISLKQGEFNKEEWSVGTPGDFGGIEGGERAYRALEAQRDQLEHELLEAGLNTTV